MREKAAIEAGYGFMAGRTRRRDRERPGVTTMPSRAIAIAGSSSRRQESFPWARQAMCRPATVPGTPTDRWLSWCFFLSYAPAVRNIVGELPAGAVSRKS